MKIKLLGTALALGLVSTTASAVGTIGSANADWQIYSWQNWTYEFSDVDDNTALTASDRKQQRIRNNASHLGFRGSVETGLSMGGQAVKTNFQCEQFLNFGHGAGDVWCNRNSKISLSGAFGEIMWGNWLSPYNEVVAGWVDPYWDADFTSHTALMGTINSGDYANSGFAGENPGDGGAIGANGFNKRQSGLVQYWSPSLNGLHFRVATTNGGQGDTEVLDSTGSNKKLDPRMYEGGISYTTNLASGDNIWLAATYSKHDEWAAVDFACSDSDDTGYRLAGKFTHQWGGGASTAIAAMWENIEYDWEDCTTTNATFVSVADGGNDLDLEKDTWLVSFTHAFGNGWDVRGMYMDADEFDCSTGCTTEDDTDATAYSGGIGYTTPGGTMFAVKYAHVDNEDNSRYDTGIYPAGGGTIANGADSSVWAFSITAGF